MKTKIRRFSKSVLSVILAMTLIMSTMLIGTISVNAVASITIYAIPSSYSDLSSYVESDGSINSNYILRARVQEGGQGAGLDDWRSFQFSLVEGETIGGKKVYSATITTLYSGVNSILYQVVTSDKLDNAYDGEASYKVFQKTWTNDSTYSNKLWDGSEWVDPITKYDTKYYVVGNDSFVDLFDTSASSNWGNLEVEANKMTYNSATTYYEKTFTNNTGSELSVEFKVHSSTGTWSPDPNTPATVPANATLKVVYDAVSNEIKDAIVTQAVKTYNIKKGTVDAAKGDFTVTVNGTSATSAAEGDTVTVTPSPVTTTDYSYAVDEVSYTTDGVTKTTVTANDGVYSFAMPAKNVTVNVTFKKKYTITSGPCTGGSVGLGAGGTSTTMTVDAADSGTVINVTAKPDTNYEFVSWVDTDGVEFTDSTSSETTATITKNATITAKFRSTAVAPYYLSYYHKKSETEGENKYVPMTPNKTDGTYTFNFTSTYVNENSGKFKITNSDSTNPVAADQNSMCINRNNPTIQVSDALTADHVTVTNLGSNNYYDIQVSDTTKEYKITFKPNSTNPLTGTIYVDYLSSTPTPNLSLSPTSANLAVGETLKLTATHTGCEGTVSYASNATGVANVSESGVVTAVAKGTATITATCTKGETATCTVTVSAIPNEQSDRIYAYAGTDATPKAQGWIAAEYAAAQQQVYNNESETNETSARQFPSLGATTKENLRLFLPTSASPEQVVLYNSFSYAIKINDTTIPAGDKATVSYTPGTTYKVYNGETETEIKTLTIYKSDAQGALYLNNTGEYSSFDENGVPEMLRQLYLGKDDGEIGEGLGNAGAYSDSKGAVTEIGVKKIKGRGNSTWKYTDKKSFNVTFADKFKGFGFTKGGKKYSLLANFKDASLSRNKILYQLAELMGAKYVPEVATIDLYMNGLYMGSYLMCQKIEVGPNEVVNDLDSKTLLDTKTAKAETAAAGFSFLMELDSNSKPGADYLIKVGEQNITLKEPEYLDDSNNKYNDDLTTAIDAFVTDKYNKLNTAISDTSITYDELNKIIDVKSLANYYLLNELAKNYDIGVTSTYLVYNKTDDKFYISPVWDLDVSTGNCDKGNNNYTSYEGNWTNNNSGINYFMKKVFDNPQVQSAARAKWTDSYYTELVQNIRALVNGGTLSGKLSNETTVVNGAITDISGSYENNFIKWSYPYGFTAQEDYINARTSLTTASYDVSTHTYSKASSDTSYSEGKTAQDTINYVRDWLLSRAAWMTNKYNTYTLSGYSEWDEGSAVTNSSVNGVTTWKLTSSSSTSAFKISTDGYDGINMTHACINYDPSVNIVNASSVATISAASGDFSNFGFTTNTGTISESSPVFLIYNQKTNTLTLSDTPSTSTNPSVTLSGSNVANNEDIKDGTAVTLTATITPATNNNVVVTGEYTAKLYIGERVVTTEKVNFTNTDKSKVVTFSTYLEGTNQTYKVVVTCNDGEQDRTGTSNPVIYKQEGVKDRKIYFDPSTHTKTVDSATVYDWLDATTKDSTVTVTIKNSSSETLDTFTMYIDSDDIHGLDKGVFRGDISEKTLDYFKDSSNKITFSMKVDDTTTLTCPASGEAEVTGDSRITSGWIYNYSSQVDDDGEGSDPRYCSQALWEQYNVEYVEDYPRGCKTYAEFKDYLAEQKKLFDQGKPTDNIVYFDNSASKWYNVYIYGWGSSGPTKDAVLMKKLRYADIWYYDFGNDNVTASFLFKDRSNRGYGNNYQQTVDLVTGYVLNGDNERVNVDFESTINKANPIFITQNFYKVTQQNGGGVPKFRAFNTQWDEFAEVVASDVQTKAVDIYFDLHNKTAKDIQLYHTSTNLKYKFVSEFTRLTQMPGSTIYYASIKLPYTDNGIAFKFVKFVVNYSDGSKKTCAMSAKVQPEFTCINTGEVWYEINSEFDDLNIDPKVDSASLLTANSPLLTAGENDVYIVGDMNGWSAVDSWKLTNLDNNKYVGVFTIAGSSSSTDFQICYGSTPSDTAKYSNGGFEFNNGDYNKTALGLTNGQDRNMTIKPISTTGQITLYVTYYKNYESQTRLQIVQSDTASTTTLYFAGKFNSDNSPAKSVCVWNGSNDLEVPLVATDKTYKEYTVYKAENVPEGSYTHLFVTTGTRWDDINVISNTAYQSSKLSGKLYYSTDATQSNATWISDPVWDATDEPTISLSADSTSLTLDNGTASTTLTPKVTNASGKKVTYSVDNTDGVTLTPSADTLSAEFKATKAGTYVVTATIEGTTATAQVTIKVSEPVTTDYCGVLAYNHSTATFDVTGGGTITNTDVVLTNGYYTTDNVTTGYTSYDGTTYTVIYALPSTASSGATTSYSSTTIHPASDYKFNDWTKNGIVKSTDTDLSDDISGTSTVAYVANWSQVKKVSYTFTYKYYEFNTSLGMAYADGRATILNEGYVIQVTLPENSSDAVIKAAYLANAPKLESDYYIYTFDGVEISVNGLTASAIANNNTIRYYTVRFDNGNTTTVNNYYYQHVAELSYDGDVPEGKYVAWKNENGEILHYGTTYKFRVTRNIDIKYEVVNSDSVSPATYVNEPTYEFYINNTGKEYVRFNILVENVLADLSIDNVEFGTLYFFTDSTGKPNDSTISVEADLDPNTLITVSEDGKLNVKSGVGQHNVNTVSSEYKYIYAPKMPNTSANVDRYVRVYSYIAVKDDNGKYTKVIVSNSYALASIRDALNKS